MSQIDKAFLSAYSKKLPRVPSSQESATLVDPTGERLLKIHRSASKLETMQPHVAPHASEPAPNVPTASVETNPTSAVRVAQSSVRIASSSSIHIDKKEEPPRRKTLTSYLQQARQSPVAAPLPTRWAPAPTVQPPRVPEQHSIDNRPAAPSRDASSPTKSVRFDAAHSGSKNPPVTRPESLLPWSYGTVERGIKATADTQSVAARVANETKPIEAAPHLANIPAAKASSRDIEPAASERPVTAEPPISPPPAASQSTARARVDSPHRPAALGKSLDVEALSKITMPIQPAWEIDEFLWPSATANLLYAQEEAFYEIGLHLQHAQSKGLRVLSVTSGERGVGRSTVAMCLAKTLSKLGMRIGLIDGDYECPSLVDQLNLETQAGWQQCLHENIPLDEVAIHSISESITFFPLTDSIALSHVAAHAARINKLLKRIANAYDMVIIDGNRVTQKQSQLLGTGDEASLDAALVIVDAELSLRQRIDAAIELLKQQGVQSIGLVENFHS